jgi:hypothetical protein
MAVKVFYIKEMAVAKEIFGETPYFLGLNK